MCTNWRLGVHYYRKCDHVRQLVGHRHAVHLTLIATESQDIHFPTSCFEALCTRRYDRHVARQECNWWQADLLMFVRLELARLGSEDHATTQRPVCTPPSLAATPRI